MVVFQVGQGKLTVIFSGTLNDNLRGFYRCKSEYQDEYGACSMFAVSINRDNV